MFRRRRKKVILFHGTSMARSECILRDGFSLDKARFFSLTPILTDSRWMYFTSKPETARQYALGRAALEQDQPAVIMCCIDLSQYRKYRRFGEVYSFKHDFIGSDVILRVTELAGKKGLIS